MPSVPDQHADRAARADLEQDNPPRLLPPEQRAAGPMAQSPGGASESVSSGTITLRSPAFSDHDFLPARCSREGEDRPPALEWSPLPDGTAEALLLCEDLDAPGGAFVHWLINAIPPSASEIGEDTLPGGAQVARNGYGDVGWGGPHPPAGEPPHRYVFRLLALDDHVELPAQPSADEVHAAAEPHLLASATLVARYVR